MFYICSYRELDSIQVQTIGSKVIKSYLLARSTLFGDFERLTGRIAPRRARNPGRTNRQSTLMTAHEFSIWIGIGARCMNSGLRAINRGAGFTQLRAILLRQSQSFVQLHNSHGVMHNRLLFICAHLRRNSRLCNKNSSHKNVKRQKQNSIRMHANK